MSLAAPFLEAANERGRTAGRFADVLETEVKSRRNPFIFRVVTWFNLCRLCQDVEEQMLLAAAPPGIEEMQLHRALLCLAISSGEGLLLEGGDPDALQPLGMAPESIDAKIDSLRITFEQWHTELRPERQAAVLKEVFGAPA